MKTKTFLKGAAAGLMSISLLLSGMPVMATEGNVFESQQQTEGQNENTDLTEETIQEQENQEPSKEQDSVQSPEREEPAQSQEKVDEENQEELEEQEPGTEQESEPEKKPEEETKTEAEEVEEDKEKTEEMPVEEETENLQTMIQNFSLDHLSSVNGDIAVDGDLSDWAEVKKYTSNASNVDSWKVAFSPDGNTLYFCYTGTATTEWDYGFASAENSFKFIYKDGHSGENSSLLINAWNGGAVVKNGWWADISGAAAVVSNGANGNNPGPYTVEFSVPVSYFHSMDFTVDFGGTSLSSEEIQQVNGNAVVEEKPAVYQGITIDGTYSDWDAVAKTEASCPNDQHKNCISQVTAVFDGDWFYIYIKDGKGSNASGAGTHSNGKYAITSDLGYETDIQLTTAPAVNGINGAKVAYVGSEWEIAIPKDQLPKYKSSLSFGLYLQEPLVRDIMNLQEDSGNNLENLFDGIIYDGSYEDWEDYGHSTIEYATAGSQEAQVDAKGALYSTGEKLFGHVFTTMPQHLQEAGGEFTAAVTIAFNQKQSDLQNGTYNTKMAFYPRFVTVDPNGNINWNPQLSGLSEGTYEFYIASLDAWGQSTNINHLVTELDQLYGKMMVTVGKDGKDEMEFYLELPMIAKKLGVNETDLKEIAGQFGRLGRQWIFTAGTSTGPLAGVTLCIVSAGFILWYKKRNLLELLSVK